MIASDQPNILVLCTDQHRFDALGCYRNPAIDTPAIDRLAADGVLFERCYTPSPVCAPARASMLTGLFPHAHGLWANGVAMPQHQKLLGRVLADHGYDCGLVGKLHLAACHGGRTEPRYDDGFRVYRWSISPAHASPENSYQQWLQTNFPNLWKEQRTRVRRTDVPHGHILKSYEDMPTEAHYTRWVAEETIEYLHRGRQAEKPFFFFANFFDPHHPFIAPEEYLAKYGSRSFPKPIRAPQPDDNKPSIQAELSSGAVGPKPGFVGYEPDLQEIFAAYYAMISLIDDEIARILQALDDSGLRENTLVVLTSDHGEMLGDHAQILKGPLFYEGAVRVPLILRWPSHLAAGRRRTELVQTLDIFATALSAAGLPPATGSPALDLLPIARGEATARARGWAMCEYRNSGYPLDPPVDATMLRTDRYKIVVHHAGQRPRCGELYDLETDPDETVNRWDSAGYDRVQRDLTECLLDALVATEDRSSMREGPW